MHHGDGQTTYGKETQQRVGFFTTQLEPARRAPRIFDGSAARGAITAPTGHAVPPGDRGSATCPSETTRTAEGLHGSKVQPQGRIAA